MCHQDILRYEYCHLLTVDLQVRIWSQARFQYRGNNPEEQSSSPCFQYNWCLGFSLQLSGKLVMVLVVSIRRLAFSQLVLCYQWQNPVHLEGLVNSSKNLLPFMAVIFLIVYLLLQNSFLKWKMWEILYYLIYCRCGVKLRYFDGYQWYVATFAGYT